jgi:hypothetical protein
MDFQDLRCYTNIRAPDPQTRPLPDFFESGGAYTCLGSSVTLEPAGDINTITASKRLSFQFGFFEK